MNKRRPGDLSIQDLVQHALKNGRKCCTSDDKFRLANAAAEGILFGVPGGNLLVMNINKQVVEDTSINLRHPLAMVYCCTECEYVGDRFYHARLHFERIHLKQGCAVKRKQKYAPAQPKEKKPKAQRQAKKQKLNEKKQESEEVSMAGKKIMRMAKKHPGDFAFVGSLQKAAAGWNDIGVRLFATTRSSSSCDQHQEKQEDFCVVSFQKMQQQQQQQQQEPAISEDMRMEADILMNDMLSFD